MIEESCSICGAEYTKPCNHSTHDMLHTGLITKESDSLLLKINLYGFYFKEDNWRASFKDVMDEVSKDILKMIEETIEIYEENNDQIDNA